MLKIDNYQLEKLLGKGEHCEVYLTKKVGENKKYSTKVFNRDEVDNNGKKQYLENEIIILRELSHPNICKFLDIKKSKRHYYIMMEYCNGGSLSKALENYMKINGKAFPEEIVQHFMRQIIDVFQYLHGKKIIQRNVKLNNILLHYENEEDQKNFNLLKAQIKIIDFKDSYCIGQNGSLYTIIDSAKEPLLLGHFRYYPSKYRKGNNESADIWLIGTICYALLIGKSVFDSESMEELVDKVNRGEYSIPNNLSYEIVSFLNGMLQYTSSKRLTAAQLFRHDFLIKDVKQFKIINLEKCSDKMKSGMINMDGKKITIWSIFNKQSETLLTSILGGKYVKPVDKEEEELTKKDDKQSLLQLPRNGIPENPKDSKVTVINKEEFIKMLLAQNIVEDNGYVFIRNIFDC